MKKFLFLLAAAVTLAVSASCSILTQEEQRTLLRLDRPVSPSDISVSMLIGFMQQATDPYKKFHDANGYIIKQTTVSEQEEQKRRISQSYLSEIKFAKPDSIRQTQYRNGTPFQISLYKDGQAWYIDPRTKKNTEVKGLDLDLFRTFTAMSNPSKTYLDIFKSVEIDLVYEDGKRCYRLICQAYNEDIAPYVVYVDAATFLTYKVETIMYGSDNSQSLYSAVSKEFKWFCNNQVRMSSITVVKTKNGQDISTITDFVLNPNIPASDFLLPQPFRAWEH